MILKKKKHRSKISVLIDFVVCLISTNIIDGPDAPLVFGMQVQHAPHNMVYLLAKGDRKTKNLQSQDHQLAIYMYAQSIASM